MNWKRLLSTREMYFHLLMLLLLALVVTGAKGQTYNLPPVAEEDRIVNLDKGEFINLHDYQALKGVFGNIYTLRDDGAHFISLPEQGPRLQYVLVAYRLDRGFGAITRTGGVALWTDAFQPLTFPQDEVERSGAIPDSRLLDDLIAALMKNGVLAGVDLTKRGVELQITGWVFPPRKDMVFSTKERAKPEQPAEPEELPD